MRKLYHETRYISIRNEIPTITHFTGVWGGGQGSGLKAKCRIVYASRTHSQLAQVIQEFRNSPYKHVSSVILASRDQLCINEQLATTSDKNQMCRAKIKTRTCEYYNNIERVCWQ